MPSNDSIIFNGHDLSSLVMCRMQRAIMPPTSLSTVSVGGRHGEHFRRVKMDAYDIPVEIWLRADDRRDVAELRHELAALLWADEPAPLYLPDDPSCYHLAIVNGPTDLGTITDRPNGCTINFHVCDPIGFGETHTAAIATNVDATIAVGGTYETRPVITSVLSGGTWRVTNRTSGEFVEVNASTFGAQLQAGTTLVCDMDLERVTVNGRDSGVTTDSLFFALLGDSTLRVTGARSTEVRWVDRWR